MLCHVTSTKPASLSWQASNTISIYLQRYATMQRLQERYTVHQVVVTSGLDIAVERMLLCDLTEHAMPSGGQDSHCTNQNKTGHDLCCLHHSTLSRPSHHACYLSDVTMRRVMRLHVAAICFVSGSKRKSAQPVCMKHNGDKRSPVDSLPQMKLRPDLHQLCNINDRDDTHLHMAVGGKQPNTEGGRSQAQFSTCKHRG